MEKRVQSFRMGHVLWRQLKFWPQTSYQRKQLSDPSDGSSNGTDLEMTMPRSCLIDHYWPRWPNERSCNQGMQSPESWGSQHSESRVKLVSQNQESDKRNCISIMAESDMDRHGSRVKQGHTKQRSKEKSGVVGVTVFGSILVPMTSAPHHYEHTRVRLGRPTQRTPRMENW